MRSFSRLSCLHRSATLFSNSSSVSWFLFATASLTFDHNRSAGFSSGVYGGSRDKVRLGGTVDSAARCPGAPSHTNTTCLLGLLTCVRANSRKKISTQLRLSRGKISQNTVPLAGCTAAYSHSHSYFGETRAVGRLRRFAHTRRRIGCNPIRASSIAHT